MVDILNFMAQHPFLSWCLAWGLWPICSMIGTIITAPFSYPYRAYKRYRRSLDIQSRGWPTAKFMDADGDIIHPPKEEK